MIEKKSILQAALPLLWVLMVGNPHLGTCKTKIAQGYFRPLGPEGLCSATNPIRSHPVGCAPNPIPAALQLCSTPGSLPSRLQQNLPCSNPSWKTVCPNSLSLLPPGMYIHTLIRKGLWHGSDAYLATGFACLTMECFSLEIRVGFLFFSSVVFVYTWIFKISSLKSYIG